MNVRDAYNSWSVTYDSVANKTRDLEGSALKNTLSAISFNTVLEVGCGTGKNTSFFIQSGKQVTAVDFSEEMLAVARNKHGDSGVTFVQADITQSWKFGNGSFDLVTFSLVLEHIQDLRHVFSEAAAYVKNGGYLYVGELHPFKQYLGSKARFETGNGVLQLECYTHHISEFFEAAQASGFECVAMKEWFDEDENAPPRILTMVFRKKQYPAG